MELANTSSTSALLTIPSELRDRIYRYCFEDIPRPRESLPDEPAVTFVSKLIRQETLPIYYSLYILPIHTYVRTAYHGQVWLRTERWYHRYIPNYKLKLIEHFRLHFALILQYTGERVPIDFHIHLLRRTNNYSLRHSFETAWVRDPHRIGDQADFDELVSVVRNHLMTELNKLVEEPGIGNFAGEHLDRLVKIDPDSLPLRTCG